jgi:hypothetical protein
MYEIGDEIYCLSDFKEFEKGTYYRITGIAIGYRETNFSLSRDRFYSTNTEFELTKLYFHREKYLVSIVEIKNNFISIEEYEKIKNRETKINQILQSI